MAIPTEANYKLEVDKIAAALNVMWASDAVVSNPMHPLRRLAKQLLMDNAGVVSTNNTYIAEAYAGKYPTDAEDIDSKIYTP